jgi:crotonobetainyl-CoA:carnitine CoA-transferase CaiB-like acyl-CoA transferase
MVSTLAHPLAGSVNLVASPIKLSATPAQARRAPPLLGQHTDEVLAELGLSAEDRAGLRARGVV